MSTYAPLTYTSGGLTFAISFDYQDAKDIVVTVGGVVAEFKKDYWIDSNRNLVVFRSPVSSGVNVVLSRETKKNIKFHDGSVLGANDINSAVRESVMRLQEKTAIDSLRVQNDLSDLQSVSDARNNLGVYSTAEFGDKINAHLAKENNLSDLTDTYLARGHLLTYSKGQVSDAIDNQITSVINSGMYQNLVDVYRSVPNNLKFSFFIGYTSGHVYVDATSLTIGNTRVVYNTSIRQQIDILQTSEFQYVYVDSVSDSSFVLGISTSVPLFKKFNRIGYGNDLTYKPVLGIVYYRNSSYAVHTVKEYKRPTIHTLHADTGDYLTDKEAICFAEAGSRLLIKSMAKSSAIAHYTLALEYPDDYPVGFWGWYVANSPHALYLHGGSVGSLTGVINQGIGITVTEPVAPYTTNVSYFVRSYTAPTNGKLIIHSTHIQDYSYSGSSTASMSWVLNA